MEVILSCLIARRDMTPSRQDAMEGGDQLLHLGRQAIKRKYIQT